MPNDKQAQTTDNDKIGNYLPKGEVSHLTRVGEFDRLKLAGVTHDPPGVYDN